MSIKSKGTKNNTAVKEKYSSNVTALAPLKLQERNSGSGIMGDAARASHHSNTDNMNPAPDRQLSTVAFTHPARDASVKPYASIPSPATASTPPLQSTPEADSLRLSGTQCTVSNRARNPTGTLMKNTARHDQLS